MRNFIVEKTSPAELLSEYPQEPECFDGSLEAYLEDRLAQGWRLVAILGTGKLRCVFAAEPTEPERVVTTRRLDVAEPKPAEPKGE